MINVTKTFLPPKDEYLKYLDTLWSSGWITNNGVLVKDLESKLRNYLSVENLVFCNNGTIALQIALKALGIHGEVITTPFSYVATTNSILWEGCTPVFVDIRKDDFCIDAELIEEKITENTTAILAVHVYGYPCDVHRIEEIARKHNLRVIYDGAHAFGVEYGGKSLLSYGDVTTCSFHATKLFHTVEGGAMISNDRELAEQMRLEHMFGHIGDDYFTLGINGKNSEFHAAMGHCVLPYVLDIIERRRQISERYDQGLHAVISRPKSDLKFKYNYSYYPVLFENENVLLRVRKALLEQNINTRRYFYPSLNKLPFLANVECAVSDDISSRVLALPLYYDLAMSDVDRIVDVICNNL